jgi:predicted transcriptional regulator
MTITQVDLDSFHSFATARISSATRDMTIDDLVVEWDSHCNRDDINAAIREGLDDIDSGRTRPAQEATEDLRIKFGLSE